MDAGFLSFLYLGLWPRHSVSYRPCKRQFLREVARNRIGRTPSASLRSRDGGLSQGRPRCLLERTRGSATKTSSLWPTPEPRCRPPWRTYRRGVRKRERTAVLRRYHRMRRILRNRLIRLPVSGLSATTKRAAPSFAGGTTRSPRNSCTSGSACNRSRKARSDSTITRYWSRNDFGASLRLNPEEPS